MATITGTADADTLKGTAGNDTFTGGAGNDVFVVSTAGGTQTDTITDFGTIYFGGAISGSQQAPSVATSASGTFTGALHKGNLAFDFGATLTGLDLGGQTATTTDNVTAAHFHLGAAGTSGGIVYGFIGVPNNEVDGDTIVNPAAGTVSGQWDANEGNGTTLTAQLQNLLNGQLYINFHTGPNPGGEIRGQVIKLDTGADQIDLRSTGITNFSQLNIADVSGSAHITVPVGASTYTLVLQGVPTSALAASDFIFAGTAPPPPNDALTTDFINIHMGRAPTAPEAATLASLNQQLSAGQITAAQAVAGVVSTANSDTSVALQTYAFFTGATPSAAGMAFLTNSPSNPTDLNDPYYSQFNLENRYVNFAANLGVAGAGAATFAANYGSLTFGQAVAQAYDAVLGNSNAAAAGINVAAALADVTSRQAYFQAYGQLTGNPDLGAKAAMIGYLMAEGIKAGIGAYAVASNNFMLDLTDGAAQFNVDLVGTYAPTLGHTTAPTMPTVDPYNPYSY